MPFPEGIAEPGLLVYRRTSLRCDNRLLSNRLFVLELIEGTLVETFYLGKELFK